MKIIEKRDYSDWTHRFTCSKCESTLEAEADDIEATLYNEDGPCRPATWAFSCSCAVCGQEHHLIHSTVPHVLHERAKVKRGCK